MKRLLSTALLALVAGSASAEPRAYYAPLQLKAIDILAAIRYYPGSPAGPGSATITGGTLTSGGFVLATGTTTIGTDSDAIFLTDTATFTKIIGSTSITDSGLTAGRLTFAGAAGLLTDDADLTFATDTLTATKIATTTFTGAPLAATGIDIGSAAAAFRDLYFHGSGTFGTTSYQVTGTPTAARTVRLPDTDVDFDPVRSLFIFDDFACGAITTGAAGQYGFSVSAIATGTLNDGCLSGVTNIRTGGFSILSHATNDNSGGSINVSGSLGTTKSNETLWTLTNWELDTVIIPGSASTAITSTVELFGLSSTLGADAVKTAAAGIWVRHDSDLSDTTWVFAVCNSATSGCASAGDDTAQKVVASTITPVAGTPNRIRIRQQLVGVGGARTIYFRVNDETEKTFCASGCDDTLGTVPAGTVTMSAGFQKLTRTTSGVLQSEIDYASLRIPDLPARY